MTPVLVFLLILGASAALSSAVALANVVRSARSTAGRLQAEPPEAAELRDLMARTDKIGVALSEIDAPPRPIAAFGQCPVSSCKAQGYHLIVGRDRNTVRRECQSCGCEWTEAL